MGISSRDYVRDSSSGGYSGRGFTSGGSDSGWKWIIGITVAVFVLQLAFRQSELIDAWFELSPDFALRGQVWRFVTYAFCHSPGNLLHILFNMLWLLFLARTLEQMYGTREFVLFYLASAIFSGILFVSMGLILNDRSAVIGASGAVMAVTMLYALHFPRQVIRLWGIIPIEMRWLVILTIIFETYNELQQVGGRDMRRSVAHAAHLGGLAFGFVYYKQQWRLEGLWERLRLGKLRGAVRSRVSPPNVKIYEPSVSQPPTENLDAQVDTILAKIHEQGEASLTDEEREVLKNASRRYKKR